MSKVDWLARVGEVRELARAYTGTSADDRPGQPSIALQSYLRSLWRDPDFSRAATVVRQISELLEEDWDDPELLDTADLLGLPQPSDGRSIPDWLRVVGDLVEHALEKGNLPADGPPSTAYEWTASYRNLAGLISNAYHLDAFVLHGTAEDALARTLSDFGVLTLARAVGEAGEILALGLPENAVERGVRWMGLQLRTPASTCAELVRTIVTEATQEIARRR